MSVSPAATLRIVHVSDCYAPRLGGIEVQVSELAKRQAAAGHQVRVVTATPGADEPEPAVPVHRVAARLPFELPVHPRAGRHLRRLFDELAPDVVHVHVGAVSPFAWSAARCAVRAGLPVVATVHSIWDPITRAVYAALDAAFRWGRWPLVLAPVSEAAAVPVRKAVGGRLPVRVVPNGLDIEAWRPHTEAAPAVAPGGQVRVVAIGRLAPRKQPLTLLRVLQAASLRVGPGASLRATIVGDGPAEQAMRRYLDRHRMTGWVELVGRMDRQRLPDVLAQADVFVAPATREAFGLAALEARTAGVPIVARRGTGIADFVADGHEGLLADGPEGLADAVVRLVTDHELRATITATNRASAPARSAWPAVLAALQRCYVMARPGVRTDEPAAR